MTVKLLSSAANVSSRPSRRVLMVICLAIACSTPMAWNSALAAGATANIGLDADGGFPVTGVVERVGQGTVLRLSAGVASVQPAYRRKVTVQRRVGQRWAKIGSCRLNRAQRCIYRWRAGGVGSTVRFRVTYRPPRGPLAVSRPVTVRVVPPLAPVDAAAAVGRLNAIRAANGIPGNLVIDDEMSLGCRQHALYMSTASHYKPGRNFAPHQERPGEPNGTTLGERAASSSALSGTNSFTRDERIRFYDRPDWHVWQDAPLHEGSLLNPWAATAWWGAQADNACMGVGGGYIPRLPRFPGDPLPPGAPFYSFPGDGAEGVPWATSVLPEWPFNPATRLGLSIGRVIGPVVYLFTRDLGRLVTVTVSGPDGPVAIRIDTDGHHVFFPSPLRPNARYHVSVLWEINPLGGSDTPTTNETQQFAFTTGAKARAGIPLASPTRLR